MEAHVAAENDHDLDAIMATFADDAELIFNSNTRAVRVGPLVPQ
jgi:hypothetical protein